MAGIRFDLSSPEALDRFRELVATATQPVSQSWLKEKAEELGVHRVDFEKTLLETLSKNAVLELQLVAQQEHSKRVNSVAFSPDGKYALSGGLDRTLKLWEIATGKEVRTFEGHFNVVYSVAFSPDGKYALSGSEDGTSRLWDLHTGSCERVFKGHNISTVTPWIYCISFSPDMRYVLSGTDRSIILWDIESGNYVRCFENPKNDGVMVSIAFSPCARYFLSGTGNGIIRQRELSTGKEAYFFKIKKT